MNPKKMWVIIQDGQFVLWESISQTRSAAKEYAERLFNKYWEDIQKSGWACIKVTITEGWEAREA